MNTLGPTKAQTERMKQNIMGQIAGMPAVRDDTTPIKWPQTRTRLAIGAVALAASLVIVGVVVPRGNSSEAQAATALTSAADASLGESDLTVGPGQFFKVETRTRGTALAIQAHGEDLAWMASSQGDLYIPYDRSDDWVWDRHLGEPTQFQDTASRKFALDEYATQKGDGDVDGISTGPGGVFYTSSKPEFADFFGTDTRTRSLSELPLSVAGLRDYLKKTWNPGASGTEDEDAWVRITELLETGAAPANLRAVLYKVLATLPGIAIINNDTNLDGQSGVAIGRTVSDVRSDIIIDPKSGQLIGERSVALKPYLGWPAGTSISWTSMSTSVVNAAP